MVLSQTKAGRPDDMDHIVSSRTGRTMMDREMAPMTVPYSQDLRTRVARAASGGSSARPAANRFGIGNSTAIRWAQPLQAEGHVEACAMGGDHRSCLSRRRESVLRLIAHQPDLALEKIRSALIARHGITVGRATSQASCHPHHHPQKSLHAAVQQRPDVAEACHAFVQRQPALGPECLVFLDEKTTTQILRLL
jgi:transposase